MAKITFMGGARTVTGSSYLVEANGIEIVIDCGLFQGKRELRLRNFRNPLIQPGEVDYLLLTHAHIDHSGLIPRFCKQGFKGSIYATSATVDLCQIMLPDAGHIQEIETEFDNRKAKRRGEKDLEPLYTADDARACLGQFKSVRYGQMTELRNGVRFRMVDAGHILGSAMIELFINENGENTKIVFGGDMGRKNTALIRDPAYIDSADYLLLESTYGNRFHEPVSAQDAELRDIINKTIKRNGNVVIPAFAVERTQELLFHLNNLLKAGEIPHVPVFVDSPLAVSATEIFMKNREYFDYDLIDDMKEGDRPFDFPGTRFVRAAEESKEINTIPGSKIIISASGMADAGRIKHHLKHNLWRPESSIVFVGYQAEGTLGRRIVEKEPMVKIMGETVKVAAEIHKLDAFSAHADQQEILEWVGHITDKPKMVFVVHGESEASSTLAGLLESKYGLDTMIPDVGEEYTLVAGKLQMTKSAFPMPEMDVQKRALLAIIHLEKRLSDLKEDLVITGGDIGRRDELEKLSSVLEAKVGEFERMLIRK